MPIYEWRCGKCGLVSEEIAPARAANRRRRCVQCGNRAGRILSSFGIAKPSKIASLGAGKTSPKPRVPSFARLCGMDDFSAARMVAYKAGDGTRFDDEHSFRTEQRKVSLVSGD